jgi:hypothetical protein
MNIRLKLLGIIGFRDSGFWLWVIKGLGSGLRNL